ncbi:hypothetical protein AB5J62_24545 [Amycolatopsis sp. cg5]|uniref:hypothetical protein n=1 Tax=Amycolatopsis sp. cg5 TaxID=3238802 RepID=UPI0035249E5A
MSDSAGTPLVGEYSSSSPALDTTQYGTIEALNGVVSDLVFNSDGSHASLSRATVAEAWYELEKDFNKATKRLGDINQEIAKEIKALKDSLAGEAGDALQKYATDILNESEELYNTLEGRKYGTAVGNVGHAIQAFAGGWWNIIENSDEKRKAADKALRAFAATEIALAKSVPAVNAIQTNLKSQLESMNNQADDALVKDLQGALSALGAQYNTRGGDFVPLKIINGLSKANDSRYTPGVGAPGPTTSGGGTSGEGESKNPKLDDIPATTAEGGTPGEEGGGDGQSKDTTPALDREPVATEGGEGAGKQQAYELDDMPATSTAGGTPGGTSGGTSGGEDTASTAGLDSAKQAADQAIGGLTSPTGDTGAGTGGGSTGGAGTEGGSAGGTGSGGVGTGLSPETQKGLDDAKAAAGQAIDGLSSQTDDPARQQALEEAKNAAGQAIDGLSDPSGAAAGGVPAIPTTGGGAGSGGGTSPEDERRQQALADAKKAADDAIDGLTDPAGAAGGGTPGIPTTGGGAGSGGGTSPEDERRKQALADAKKAAGDAIDDLTNPDGLPSTESGGPGGGEGAGDVALDKAKEAAGKSIDDLSKPDDSPERKEALEEAKKAAQKAIDDIGAANGDPEAIQKAKDAAGAAIDDLTGKTDDPQAKQALQDAKEAADKAIGDATKPEDPVRVQALEDAKSAADKAIDSLASDGTPEEKAALAEAKAAVDKAIDSAGGPRELEDFLAADRVPVDSLGGAGGGAPDLGGGAGGGGVPDLGGGAGGGGMPDLGGVGGGGGVGGAGVPAVAEPAVAGQFDTQPGQRGAPAGIPVTASSAGASVDPTAGMGPGGMPMGAGGMGGGGAGAGQEGKEREPQIWLQADKGAWDDPDNDRPDSPVLGRD